MSFCESYFPLCPSFGWLSYLPFLYFGFTLLVGIYIPCDFEQLDSVFERSVSQSSV